MHDSPSDRKAYREKALALYSSDLCPSLEAELKLRSCRLQTSPHCNGGTEVMSNAGVPGQPLQHGRLVTNTLICATYSQVPRH